MNSNTPVVLLDLDNCIANDAWRIPFINWSKADPDERYHPYHVGAYYDESDLDWFYKVVKTHDDIAGGAYRLFVLTARAERYRELTTLWLMEQLIQKPEAVLMRANGDNRHSASLKEQQLLDLTNPNTYNVSINDIAFAADDRQDVLDMYRMHSVKHTIRHAIHDVCAYTAPDARKIATAPKTVPEILHGNASIYATRNAVYGDNYKHFGHTMMGVFPSGLRVDNVDDWNRLALLMHCADKLTRYGKSFGTGGHTDSANDLSVYAAMLQELTQP